MKQFRDAKGRFVRGAGGGGGGGGGGGAEAPDSLRSNQLARYIDALCEGEIRGLVNGLKSVYINGTPLENADGSQNFGGIDLQWRNGTLTQTPMDGFSGTEIENYVGTEVKAALPITRTLNNQTCKEVRVTVAVPGLTSYDSNGNINGSFVSFDIAVQNNGGGFVTMVTDTISGKTQSKYKRAYRLKLPGSGPWDIRVTRTTPDSTSSKVQNSLFFDAFTGIVPSVVAYINTAVVGVALNAQQFTGVPERGYEIYGRIIQVPTNYDPLTRAYSGAWDGSFKMAWSDNPAWCFYDMLTQPRFGLGDFVDASTVDKWSLYTIGKYCDQMVPNGMGGTEPRFSCNLVLQSREDAYKVIQNMASIFRAIAYWGAAGVIAVQDRPGDVAAVYTNANVIDGKFTYQGSSTNVRHTVALVAWSDPNDGYKQTVEYVQDDELVEKYGIIQMEVTAFGCTSRAQAHRYGRWALLTEKIETETVSFSCGFDGLETGTGAGLYPGAVIQTSDILRAGKRMGGRLKDGNTTTVLQLDSPVTLIAGKQYRVLVAMPEGKPLEREVINVTGEVQQLTLASALPQTPAVDAVFALVETDSVELEMWRVLGVVESDTGALECTAIKHNPSKYDSVELGFALDEIPISNISARPSAPTGLTFVVAQRSLDGSVSNLTGTLSWEGNAAKYRVSYRFEKEAWVSMETQEQSIDVPNLQIGQYEFAVTAVSALGITSMQATLTHAVTPQPIQLPDIAGLMMEGTYITDTAKFKWNAVAGATGYEVKIEAGGQVRRTVSVGDALRFDYASADMRVDGGPWRSYTFSVRAVGKWGSASSWASLAAGNPQIAALQGIKIESGIKTGYFSCAAPVEDDFAGIIIWLSTDPACSPVPANQVYEGQDTFVTLSHLSDGTPLAGGTTYYLRAAGYDTFGMDSLNVSTSMAFEVYSLVPDANSVGLTQFASGLEPVTIVTGATLPTVKSTSTIMWKGKLYRWNGSAYVSSVAAGDVTGQITSTQIADDAITSPKIAANAVTASELAADAVVAGKIAAAAISTREIAANAVTADKIAANAVTASEIAADAVVAGKIAAAAISTREIATNAVTADKIAANSITGDKLVVNSITGDKLVANTITGDKIQAGTVTANLLQSGTGGGNLLPNSAFAAQYTDSNDRKQADGWVFETRETGGTSFGGIGIVGGPYSIDGVNVLQIYQGTARPSNGAAGYRAECAVVGGAFYEASVYTGASACTAFCVVEFFDAAGNNLNASFSTSGNNSEQRGAGGSFATLKRVFGIGQAPAGAVRARFWMQKTANPSKDGLAGFVQPYFGVANGPSQSQPSPWSPSGVGTQIHGGVLKTGTVTADRLAVTSLSAITANLGYVNAGAININNRFIVDGDGTTTIKSASSGARVEMNNSLICVYDGNGALRVRLGIW